VAVSSTGARRHSTTDSAILFDWDNTLVDNWGAIYEALNLTLAAMGQAIWSDAEARLRVQRSLRDSFPEMFGDCWQEASEILYRSFAEVHLRTLRPMPGAAALLETLTASGIYLAVVSNKTKALRLKRRTGWNTSAGWSAPPTRRRQTGRGTGRSGLRTVASRAMPQSGLSAMARSMSPARATPV
jgi:phosphoglycolate phosphatase